MNHWCSCFSALLLLSALCHVGKCVSIGVDVCFSAALCASFTLNCERNGKSTEKEKMLHILRNLRSLSMKDLMSVNCWMLKSFIHVALELLCVIRFPVVCLLSLSVWWHSDGDMKQGPSFLPPLVAFPLFSSDTFNHFSSCHYLHENERLNIKE